MIYPSIRIEGAILSPDILDRLDDAAGQRPADFGLDTGTKVKDEIARAWADAQDYWRIFQRKLETLRPESPATTETRQQWVTPLLGLLGYQLDYQAKGVELNGKTYAISHRLAHRGNTPIHIIGAREAAGLDKKPERTHIGAPRMSAHALVQEYLNLHDELYGIVTNGRILRLLRDSSRLIKLSYLEFDLDRIFSDGLFADFAILYRLLHVSRLPASSEAAAESLIERYHQDSLDSGARIRDGLSKAVEQAIRDFANGFLTHRDNDALRQSIRDGKLSPENYYQHLLRLIYRLLFLLVIEERDLVFPPSATSQKRDIYRRYYSLERLRLLSEKRHLADKRHHDLWLAMLANFSLFEAHGPGDKLGLAPLAGDLFSPAAIGPLASAMLGNDVLVGCLRSLGLYQHPDNNQTIRVNYAALNVEEFGSVYEGLLEYEPVFLGVSPRFQGEGAGERVGSIEFSFAQGDQRAATGSHYTPDDLVQPLIKHSLDYLIADALKKSDPAKALLDLRVADISCGSGHILLAAARRIATELAIVRTGEEQPSPSAFRSAIRDVIRNCIYGVDLNPLAVELCKVALWLEAHNPGEPLNFLDHHIKCGNAIVGFARREEVERGVPDEAFVTLPGDDKDTAALLRKRNKQERKHHETGQLPLAPTLEKQFDHILSGQQALSAPEQSPDDFEFKKHRYAAWKEDASLLNQIVGIPIAQFYLTKTVDNLQKFVTDAAFRRYWKGDVGPQGHATAEAWALTERKRFFHWFLEFPEIIGRGGFDCILGNPPYLMNRKLSGKFGEEFLNWVKFAFAPAAAVDLVVYFVRRMYELLSHNGFLALISTNTISQGAAREGGLDAIEYDGGCINFAVRSQRWPGRAAVTVSLVSIYKGKWSGERYLDNQSVTRITTFLDTEEISVGPETLAENMDQSFIGSYVLGLGFLMSESDARDLFAKSDHHRNVIYPYLSGDDLNGHPEQLASRFTINFFDWPEEKCETEYPDIFAIVKEKVMPERTRLDDNGQYVLRKPLPQRWWIYADKRPKLYSIIASFDRVLVTALVSKYVSFIFVPRHQVFMHKLAVIAKQDFATFAVLQSDIHVYWAWRYSSTMRNVGINYSPSACFVTFPFPEGLWQTTNQSLESFGAAYHEHRRALMKSLWLGLTDIYNLFHTRDLTPAEVARVSKKSLPEAETGYQGILELRRLHRELDLAIRDAYGWTDLELGHDFIEVETLPENDRVRYTISPTARKEVLKRLLAENHKRAAAEAAAAAVAAPAKVRRGRKPKDTDAMGDLFEIGTPKSPPVWDAQVFPWDGREAFVYGLIPRLVQARPGERFEFYRDAALLASRPQRCATLLLDDASRADYERAVRNLIWLQFPDEPRIRASKIRQTLQSKQIVRTDAGTGATTVPDNANLPPLQPTLEPLLPLILKAADNLDRMQRDVLDRVEAGKLALTKEALAREFEGLMAA
ncbi:MAG: hypothetical protein OEL20_15840 [Sulfuritalea sp.]|nr:hypothetical protein [Sulfuritalea sp.]